MARRRPRWWWCPSVSRMTQVMRMRRHLSMLKGKGQGQLAQQRQVHLISSVHLQGVQGHTARMSLHWSWSRPLQFVVFPGPDSVSHSKLCMRHLIQLWPRNLTSMDFSLASGSSPGWRQISVFVTCNACKQLWLTFFDFWTWHCLRWEHYLKSVIEKLINCWTLACWGTSRCSCSTSWWWANKWAGATKIWRQWWSGGVLNTCNSCNAGAQFMFQNARQA